MLSCALFSVIVGLAAKSASAHMFLTTPRPFDIEAGYNAPLDGPGVQGSEGSMTYPCQIQDYNFTFPRTQIAAGSMYNLTLTGSAVHGGGSCQMSLTTDLAPTASSDFRVIHSVQGGCPAIDEQGNLNGGADTPDPFSYLFEMPSVIPAGDYVFAWTWFNRVGNREMYMHCSPISVTTNGSTQRRGSEADSILQTLPRMFLANIPGVPCSTAEEGDLELPDPGTSVETNKYFPVSAPLTNGGSLDECYAPLNGEANTTTVLSSTTAAPVPPSSTPAVSSNLASSNTVSTSATSMLASSALASAPAASSTLVTLRGTTALLTSTTPRTSTALVPTPSAPTTSASGTGGGCATGSVACSEEGIIVCIGTGQFGLCNFGCAIAQDLASGTLCSNGAITRRSLRKLIHRRHR